MGKRKHQDNIKQLIAKSPVVLFSSINRIVNSKHSMTYTRLLIHNLVKQGKLKRLAKSCYTQHDNIDLCVFCFKPAYIGLQAALSMHGIWEQETIPIIITAKTTRVGTRIILGQNVLIKRIAPKYLFGFEQMQDGEFYIPYSDVEKTLIDMVVFRQPISPEVVKEMKKKIIKKKLDKYLKEYPKRIKERVLKVIGMK